MPLSIAGVAASGESSAAHAAARVLDGDVDTHWTSQPVAGAAAWLALNLATPMRPDRLSLQTPAGDEAAGPAIVLVQYSSATVSAGGWEPPAEDSWLPSLDGSSDDPSPCLDENHATVMAYTDEAQDVPLPRGLRDAGKHAWWRVYVCADLGGKEIKIAKLGLLGQAVQQ